MSARLYEITAKCSDCCSISSANSSDDTSRDGYVEEEFCIGSSDYVEFDYCLTCGRIQSEKFPLEQTCLEPDLCGFCQGKRLFWVNNTGIACPICDEEGYVVLDRKSLQELNEKITLFLATPINKVKEQTTIYNKALSFVLDIQETVRLLK